MGSTDQTAGAEPNAHVVFELEVGKDGWPPVGSERVWAFDLGRDLYRIDNPPWFVRNIAVGDVVRAVSPDAASHPVFQELVQPSDHVTIRIICFRDGPLAGDLQGVIDAFVPLGVYAEGVQQYGMVALDVAPETSFMQVHDRLIQGVEDGSWDYEEGRITQAWARLSG